MQPWRHHCRAIDPIEAVIWRIGIAMVGRPIEESRHDRIQPSLSCVLKYQKPL